MNPLEHPDKPLNNVAQEQPTEPKQEPSLATTHITTPVTPAKPTQTHDYAHPIVDAPKKTYHPKRFMIALSIFVAVCLLAVAAMVAIALLPMQQTKKTQTINNTTSQTAEKAVSAKQAIAHVKEYFKVDGVAKSGISLPIRAAGKDFYTIIPDASATVSVAGEVAPDKASLQLKSIIDSLEGDGFTEGTSGYEAESLNYRGNFTRKETVCQVEAIKPADAKANQWLEVRCADMATYQEYAKAQEPLVRLYTPLSATSVLYGFIGKPSPIASKTTGYNTAELQVSVVVDSMVTSTGKFALYYQTPDGLWHYWRDRDSSAVFACDQYDSNELKNAYLGSVCRDASKNTNSTVSPPSKKS